MSLFSRQNILSKKERKMLIGIILFSLIHNFIIFPAQAAESSSSTVIADSAASTLVVIKSPESETKRLEQLSAASQDEQTLSTINNFALPKESPVIAEKKAAKAFTIASTGNNNTTGRLVSMTAYNSERSQTDGDPCTTANGFNVCKHGVEDTVAANFLPFGTKIQIPELFGDRVFVVRDRMARRFSNRVDVWFVERSDALKFGVRQAHIVILTD